MARNRPSRAPGSVQLLYQALEQPEDMEAALVALADDLDADHVILDLRRHFGLQPEQLLAGRVDATHVQSFALHPEYAMLRAMLNKVPAGIALRQEALLSRQTQARSAFFADVIRPMGGEHCMLAFTAQSHQPAHGLIAVCRAEQLSEFSADHLDALQSVLPHLETVLRLRKRLARKDAEVWWREQVLTALPVGVILLDAKGWPCYLNPAAEALVSEGLTLALSSTQGLTAGTPQATRQLHTAIQDSLCATPSSSRGPVRVCRGESGPDLWLRVVPLTPGGVVFDAWNQASVAVFCEVSGSHAPDTTQLAHAFGFTPSEARLAGALLSGHDLSSAAKSLGVGLETVRTQLKRLFAKTDTRRQSDLLRVLMAFHRWS